VRRLISHSEIEKANNCQAQHAFGYTGHLTGGQVLKPHAPAARLRQGRAWGRGVAAFHMADHEKLDLIVRYGLALVALNESLDEDAAAMRSHGFYDEAEHHDMALKLADILWHYASTTEPLQISDPEFALELPIPSRSGKGVSNRYSFHGYLDGLAVQDGRLWLAEYKLRDSLTDYEQLVLGRQYRRYAWAAERQLGVAIAGVIVDERLSEPPKPARWVRAKRKGEGVGPLDVKGYGRLPSSAKDQLTTSAAYVEACLEAGVEIDRAVVEALDARKWQQRVKVVFKRSEIEEAGRELVSAAQLIAQLDSGALYPVRNTAPWRCRGCAFREICPRPDDRELIEASFELNEPKRARTTPALEGATT
jgi:CRISPR/Cas system-associated exonuclease Cas4 (RecB family)